MKDKDLLVNYVEDIELSDDAKSPIGGTITDSELSEVGIVKVRAYMRTNRSKNALRIQKSREKKQKEENLKQVNCQVPLEFADDLKAIAKYARDNKVMPLLHGKIGSDETLIVDKVLTIKKRGGLRAYILRFLGVY